mmetsp:Transcript_1916/g.4629  ORF Transcript_1916/g.4629 Transcript_1916/m.4629 type:complete len:205 (+) Transcript_1916:160-774(+)
MLHVIAGSAPARGEVGERHTRLLCNFCIGVHCIRQPVDALLGVPPRHELRVLHVAGFWRRSRLALLVLATQQASGQDGVGQQPDVQVALSAGFCQLVLKKADHHGASVLDTSWQWHAQPFRSTRPLANAEGRLVGHTIRLDLPLIHQLLQGRSRFLDPNGLPLFRRVVDGATKDWNVAVWPVDLVEIDAVCPQPPQRCFTSFLD